MVVGDYCPGRPSMDHMEEVPAHPGYGQEGGQEAAGNPSSLMTIRLLILCRSLVSEWVVGRVLMGIARRRSRRWLIVVAHRLGMDVLTVRYRRHGVIRFRYLT